MLSISKAEAGPSSSPPPAHSLRLLRVMEEAALPRARAGLATQPQQKLRGRSAYLV